MQLEAAVEILQVWSCGRVKTQRSVDQSLSSLHGADQRQGEVIEQINGRQLRDLGDFYATLTGPGPEVNFRTLRQDVELSIGHVR